MKLENKLININHITFVTYIYITYGNTPLKDLPAWVLPFFGGR